MVILNILRKGLNNVGFTVLCKPSQYVIYNRSLLSISESIWPSNRRNLSYEGDGKTYGVVLNKNNSEVFQIGYVTREGFILSDGKQIVGSAMVFPHTIMSWHILSAKDITEESFVLLKLLEPKIDLLVFGYGCRKDYTPEVQQKFIKICKELGLRHEALPTENAVGVFNFLAFERRLVAGAFIVPTFIDRLKFDRSKNLYLEMEDDEEYEAISDGKEDVKLLK